MNALESKAIIGFNILVVAYVVGLTYKTKTDARRERREEQQDKIISILKEIQGSKCGR